MFDRTEIIVGLEIGTAKVCAVVGELSEDEGLHVIGVGQSLTAGAVRKGEIINAEVAEDAVRAALNEAEQQSDIEIGSVHLGVTGAHIKGFNNRGAHPIASVGREIDEEDVSRVVRGAQPQLPADEEMLHTVRQHFRVDGQDDVQQPVGRVASKLEVDVHVVCGQRTRIQNPVRVVKGLGIDVEDVAFNGRVAALPILTSQLGEQGALMIDLGAGTTEYSVYLGGSMCHTGVLAVGGEHVTNDLAVGIKLTQTRAERLKLEQGSAVPDPRVAHRAVNFASEVGLDDKQVSVGHIQQIMHARLDELFRLIREDLEQNGLLRRINGSVLLTGGGARTPQINLLAHQVFELDVCLPHETDEAQEGGVLHQPECTAAMGLVKFGARQMRARTRQRKGLLGWLTH